MYMVVAYRAGRNGLYDEKKRPGCNARLVVQKLAGRQAGIVYY